MIASRLPAQLAGLWSGVILLLLARSVPAHPLPERAERVVSYRIAVRLDPEARQLQGQERIVWRNPSRNAVGDLWFHLYLNAFRNNRSTFFRESGGQLRGDTYTEGKWGWITVQSLRLGDGTDLTGRMAFVHPDDDNAQDRTVVRVPLPRPVPAGGTVTIDVAFLAQLPQVFARSGYRHDYFLVAQWFPKLGVYEPARGWNCHQYHAHSEFYADYGEYSVDLTLPSRFVVGATGARTGRRANPDGTVTHTYEQADVHDFAWTASPHFVEVRRAFRAGERVRPDEYARTAALLGRSLDEVTLSDVEVTLLMQPGHMNQLERFVESVMAGLEHFGLWYGRYPYRTLTVVDPGPGASGSAGVEYPTFLTSGTRFFLGHWPFDRIRVPESITVHEFGHQFWYGLVGNNEFEDAWLDEGLTSYATGKLMEQIHGRDATLAEFLGLKVGEVDSLRVNNGSEARFNSIVSTAWGFTPHDEYGFYAYQKPELALRTLENHLGEQTMARVMRTFHERWRFRHPSSDDFFAVANEVSGRDLGWFFDAVFRGSGVLDYEIGSADSDRVAPLFGVLDGSGAVAITRDEAERQARESARAFETVVVVRRRGEVRFPVEVALKFEGRPPERRQWDGVARTVTYKITRPERLEWAEVDPDRKVLLDAEWLNNGLRVESDARVSTRLGLTGMFWVQYLLALVGL